VTNPAPSPPDPQRARTLKLALIVGFSAILAIVVLIVVSQSGDKGGDTDIEASENTELAELEQQGDTLGDPAAPVTIVEYGDLQCPVCRQFASQVTPEIVSGPVADGTAKLQFRNWVILGPDSEVAAKAALAAGEQNLMFDFVELFYENQGPENTGYVTDEFLLAIAEQVEGLDIGQWEEDRVAPGLDAELKAIDQEATQAGATGTPTILVDGEVLAGVPDASAVTDAVEQAGG
jgi:protein-disulfide isomerase